MHTIRGILAAALLPLLAGCVGTGLRESPWQWGYGIKLSPEILFTEDEDPAPSIHPTIGWTRLSFTGGHSNWYDFGAQLRWPVTVGEADFWAGGELTLGRISSSNGIGVSGIAGFPVGTGRWNASVYGQLGITNYGATGTMLRAGVDFQPWFLPWSFR